MNRPADHTSPTAASDGLFDLPADQPSSDAPASARAVCHYVPTNDLALMRQVLDRATDPGYVLIGPSCLVWRRRVRRGAEVDRATPAEANAVRQLLDRGFLRLGGVRPARRGRHETPATSLLLTTVARAQARRWRTPTHQPEVITDPTHHSA